MQVSITTEEIFNLYTKGLAAWEAIEGIKINSHVLGKFLLRIRDLECSTGIKDLYANIEMDLRRIKGDRYSLKLADGYRLSIELGEGEVKILEITPPQPFENLL